MAEVISGSQCPARGRDQRCTTTFAREALAGRALLYMRQPQAARDEYDAVLLLDPGNLRDARTGRIYVAVEMEEFRLRAYAQADELLKQTPALRLATGDEPGRHQQ